jgi:hypothetical protein
MARKKRTTRKKTGGIFSKKKKRRKSSKQPSFKTGLKIVLVIIFLSVLVAGAAVGLIFLEGSVKETATLETPDGSLKLIDPPSWLNQEWVDKLVNAVGGKRFALNASSAQIVAEKLQTLSWLENIRVQTTPEYLTVKADYRKPVALVQAGRNRKVYLDADMNVLDFTPVSGIPVIEIKGLASTKVPTAGQQWFADDAKAAVELLTWIQRMDWHFQQEKEKRMDNEASPVRNAIPEKPLLDEIESIDVSNFSSRKKESAPNIVFNVSDGIKVYWGAAWGQAAVYSEANEKEKMAKLYQFFVDYNNSLRGTAKYIELRWPENTIPRPR